MGQCIRRSQSGVTAQRLSGRSPTFPSDACSSEETQTPIFLLHGIMMLDQSLTDPPLIQFSGCFTNHTVNHLKSIALRHLCRGISLWPVYHGIRPRPFYKRFPTPTGTRVDYYLTFEIPPWRLWFYRLLPSHNLAVCRRDIYLVGQNCLQFIVEIYFHDECVTVSSGREGTNSLIHPFSSGKVSRVLIIG